jgi:hypothetical protein
MLTRRLQGYVWAAYLHVFGEACPIVRKGWQRELGVVAIQPPGTSDALQRPRRGAQRHADAQQSLPLDIITAFVCLLCTQPVLVRSSSRAECYCFVMLRDNMVPQVLSDGSCTCSQCCQDADVSQLSNRFCESTAVDARRNVNLWGMTRHVSLARRRQSRKFRIDTMPHGIVVLVA